MTQESQTCDQKETLLLNNKMVGRKTNIAACLMSRDYKGYVKRQLGNGVIEVMADVNVIGSLEAKFESTNRIYDVGGCSPTLSTMQGGNQEPKILEARQLGFMDNGTGKHQSNTVYDENALCPNITTVEGGGTQQIKVCESQIVAMRGRNPDNPSDRTVGNPTEQRLEINAQGMSNCLTSVQKDNLVLVKQATKQGYAECEIGGGGRFEFP